MSAPRLAAGLVLALAAFTAEGARAFCGFYVGKADAQLFNQASQVAMVRDQDRTVLTMSNDFKGELTDFALVVPVPVVLKREQIHVGDRKLLERLDAYSAPRLVEYFDDDPCRPRPMPMVSMAMPKAAAGPSVTEERARALGVKVEAQYTVGEYDIVILSAKQSDGLETWLKESGYRIPPRASAALLPYIRQDMKFFVAKVNLKEQAKTGFNFLRPLQMAYESPKFMLPIRLGMTNADGKQDLIFYAMTRTGRVESTNYRTVNMPSGTELPEFVQKDFASFYKAAFEQAHKREDYRALLTEYVWDMGFCDPCAATPLAPEELRQLGVFWLDERGGPQPGMPVRRPPGMGVDVVLTRLHVRYDGEHFPEDLMFQATGDRNQFQARYVIRHPFKGHVNCAAANEYQEQLRDRHRRESEELAHLTGWDIADINQKMGPDAPPAPDDTWYKKLWH